MNEKTIIVAGNMSDGFTFIGPFNSFDDAVMHDENILQKGPIQEGLWPTWIATLEAPEKR